MPPVRRRSAQMKRRKLAQMEAAKEAEEQRVSIRDKKRRETCTHPSPSAAKNMDIGLLSCGLELLSLVSVEDNPQVIQGGVVTRLVEFLTRDENPQLQCEVARVLKNIAAGISENTKMVIDCGAVPVFVKLLESSESGIREQVAWALGNIAGDSPGYCDIVLNCGALSPLLTLLKEHSELSFLRIGTWALSNFLEGKPEVPLEQLESAIPVLSSLILTNDEVVLKEACWALLFLSHCGDEIGSTMYEADLCYKLAKLYTHAPLSVLLPAIRTVTSIVKGTKTLDEPSIQRAFEAWKLITFTYRSDLSKCGCIIKEAELFYCLFNRRMWGIWDAKLEGRARNSLVRDLCREAFDFLHEMKTNLLLMCYEWKQVCLSFFIFYIMI